tara:strand:- start:3321 stop:3713 length:393 start_codon:yes stop_codon:yes gene_type:complete
MLKEMCVVSTVVLLVGCASSKGGDSAGGVIAAAYPPEGMVRYATAQEEQQIQSQIDVCNAFFGLEGEEAKKAAKQTWKWTMLGIVAGSIVAPALTTANAAANAPWISAFSGVSGASVAIVSSANELGIGG